MVLVGRELLCANGRTSITHAYTVVPEGDIILLPLKPNMDLLGRSDQLVQIMDDCISFCLGNANYIRDEPYGNFGVSIPGSRPESQALKHFERLSGHSLPQHVSECSHTRVEENRLPPSDRVGANQRVLRDDRFPSYGTTKGNGPICLNLCRVQSLKPFEVFLHTR